jgi:uncharacterized protein YjbI with pentapeptide repeats
MPDDAGLLLDDSVRDLADDLGIDYKKLFIDLGKATVSGLIGFSTGNPGAFGGAIQNLVGAYSAFGERTDVYEQVGDDPGKLAWLLVHQSLLAAITDLVEDHDARFRAAYQNADELPTEEDIADRLGETLEVTLTDAQIRITPSFFDRPAELDVLKDVQTDLAAWFRAVGVPEGEAGSISRRLPSYFRTALIEEWRAHAEYSRLKEAVDVPLAPAERRAQAWEAYRAHLQKQVDEPVFGEAVSLQQIYVEPRAYVVRGLEGREPVQTRRHVSWLRESVMQWLRGGDESDAVRIIKGDPGTGKSSFTKMLAADLAEAGTHDVVFAQLHLLDPTKNLTDAVRDFVSGPNHPLDGIDPFKNTPLLLILDGLDELSKQGEVGARVARDFVDEIDRSLRGLNQNGIAVRVLLSGRKIAAEAGAKVLRDRTKVLNLIPFVPEIDPAKGVGVKTYADPDHLAFDEEDEPIDQRDDWWRTYGEASGTDYSDGMPDRLREGRLGDITTQPLLNYLVALAYEDDETQFSEDASLSKLYDQLLEGVYKRDYDFGPHPGTKVVASKQDFLRILEEIALDAWHKDGRTTTVASIRERCEDQGLVGHFEEVRNNLATGISQLLAAFYFRKTGQTPQGEATFEFTHKTFAEYLTAQRLVRAVEQIHQARKADQEHGGLAGRSLVESLVIWVETCGPTAMDEDLFEFFADEIRLRHERSKEEDKDEEANVEDWQETFAAFIRHTLRHDVPMEKVDASLDFQTQKAWARNAEEALLAVVRACQLALLADVDEAEREPGMYAVEVFDDSTRDSAGDWIRRLQSPLSENEAALYKGLLASIIWEETVLPTSFLRGARLRSANLRDADLIGADLRDANLRDADLIGADLRRADLRRANLRDADLIGANLRDADLIRADLRRANLRGANLRGADLRDADLRDANLRDANLRRADLRRADLRDADLRGVDLRGVTYTIPDETPFYTSVANVIINDQTQLDDDFRAYIESQNETESQNEDG